MDDQANDKPKKEKKIDTSAAEQVIERIQSVSNILVTVSKDPTVDELSAAVGLTLMLNKLDKHATAVFSGKIPPAIEFLEPDKTLENNVDSLRDFIIAIDKEKADRLRYKVEGDIVRVFITPYRTNLSEKDLEFSHGDFNVELVLALGVENQDVLDEAIAAHGKILHDATVATINAQDKTSDLGSIDWQDKNASSLCEMLVSMGESLKSGLLDEPIATALLTGIVAATDRFSNSSTSSQSMTVAAQLMAAGANQQLIASKLESASEITVSGTAQSDGSVKLDEGKSGKLNEQTDSNADEALGQIRIDHDEKELDTEPEEGTQLPTVENTTIEERDKENKQNAGEEALDAALKQLDNTPQEKAVDDLQNELQSASALETTHDTPLISKSKSGGSWNDDAGEEPSMGGSINATTQEAEEEKKHQEELHQNRTILSHGTVVPPKGKDIQPLINASQPEEGAKTEPAPTVMDIQVTSNEPKAGTLADIEAGVGAHQEANTGASLPPVPPPPLPDFSNMPPLPPTVPTPLETPAQATPTGTIPPPQVAQPAAAAPDQFRIPGQ